MKKILSIINDKLDYILLYFICLIPIFDIFKDILRVKTDANMILINEIIEMIFLVILVILYIKKNIDRIKLFIHNHKKLFIILLFLYIIFFIGHTISILIFDTNLIRGSTNSLLYEYYYFMKTFGYYLCLLFVILISNFKKETIYKTVSLLSFIFSMILIITNLTETSYLGYTAYIDGRTHIAGSFLKWPTELTPLNALSYSSRGIFYSTNQLSFVFYISIFISGIYLIQTKKTKYYISFPFKLFAAVMLTTKASCIGMYIILLTLLFTSILIPVIKKSKINKKIIAYLLCMIIFYSAVFYISPIRYRLHILLNEKHTALLKESKAKEKKEQKKLKELRELIISVEKDKTNLEIDNLVIESMMQMYRSILHIDVWYSSVYAFHDHLDFWKDIVMQEQYKRENYRIFKVLMYDDFIKTTDNKLLNNMFGIGYSSNFPFMEIDFLGQYVWYGLIGVICLVMPIILICCYYIYKLFLNLKKAFDIENTCLIVCFASCLGLSVFSGFLFGNIFPSLFLILCVKLIMENAKKIS